MPTSVEAEIQAQQSWNLRSSYNGPSIHETLLRNEFLSHEQQKEGVNRNLRRILQHCYDTVPYYRELFLNTGISRRLLRDPQSLQRIPILEKGDIEKNFKQLRARSLMPNQKAMGSTRSSGTTGQRFNGQFTISRLKTGLPFRNIRLIRTEKVTFNYGLIAKRQYFKI